MAEPDFVAGEVALITLPCPFCLFKTQNEALMEKHMMTYHKDKILNMRSLNKFANARKSKAEAKRSLRQAQRKAREEGSRITKLLINGGPDDGDSRGN